MFKADITVNYADGSLGAKVIYAASQEQVMDDAAYFVRQEVLLGRETGNEVVKHRVSGSEA